jgi:hypothetical protein
MVKLTKKILQENNLNSWNIADYVHNKLYIAYIPVDTGRGGHGAKWQVTGIRINTDPKSYWGNYGRKTFNIWDREDKPIKLAQAITWVKETCGLYCNERDPFGNYQISGTLEKIQQIIKNRSA